MSGGQEAPGRWWCAARDPRWGGGAGLLAQALVRQQPAKLAWLRIGRRPDTAGRWLADPLRVARATGPSDGLLLFSALRSRALWRDAVLARAALARGAPVVAWFHGREPGALRAFVSSAPPFLVDGLRRAQRWVLTDAALDEVERWLGPARRVDVGWDPAEVPAPAPLGESWCVLSRLSVDKGLLSLLGAPQAGRPVRIAGEGELAPALARAGFALSGFVSGEAKRRLLSEAFGLVHPSPDEAMPLAVLEAMAAGRPVVACRTGRIPELLGEGPWLARSDPADLRRAMAWLEANPRRALDLGRQNAARVAYLRLDHLAREVARRLDPPAPTGPDPRPPGPSSRPPAG